MPRRVNFRRDEQLLPKVKQFLKPYFKLGKNKVEPLESWAIIAHYKFTVGVLVCVFVSLVGCWFSIAPMECFVKYDRTVGREFQDICLSYPNIKDNNGKKVFALHYKWVHWALLVLIALYNIPLLLKKHLEVDNLNQHLYFLNDCDIKDPKRNPCIASIVDGFIGFNIGNIYFNKLLILFATLFVDFVAFTFIDVALQNRFLRLFPVDYPFTRWPQYFNDTMSLAFPPFAECVFGKHMMLLNDMEEKFGCNLSLMKIYDKMFVILWVWMAGLSLLTFFSILYYIVLGSSKYHQKGLIEMSDCKIEVKHCLMNLGLSDLMLLNCLSSLLIADENKEVLKKLSVKLKTIHKTGAVL